MELVHEPPDAGQPEAEAPRRREPLLERPLDVRDARAFVDHDHLDPARPLDFDRSENDLPARRVGDEVPHELGHGRRDARGIGG